MKRREIIERTKAFIALHDRNYKYHDKERNKFLKSKNDTQASLSYGKMVGLQQGLESMYLLLCLLEDGRKR